MPDTKRLSGELPTRTILWGMEEPPKGFYFIELGDTPLPFDNSYQFSEDAMGRCVPIFLDGGGIKIVGERYFFAIDQFEGATLHGPIPMPGLTTERGEGNSDKKPEPKTRRHDVIDNLREEAKGVNDE